MGEIKEENLVYLFIKHHAIDMNDNRTNDMIEQVISTTPLFLCNAHERLPSLDQMGGDWDLIMKLIETRKVFYSRLYKNRVTYLSNELYWSLKSYKQRWEKLSQTSQKVFGFLDGFGEATTPEIKNILLLSDKTFAKCINELTKELFITAVAKERQINNNWSSFYWGTYKLWEQTAKKCPSDSQDIYTILAPIFSEREIQQLLK